MLLLTFYSPFFIYVCKIIIALNVPQNVVYQNGVSEFLRITVLSPVGLSSKGAEMLTNITIHCKKKALKNALQLMAN